MCFLALAGGLLLLISGVTHLRRPRTLARHIAEQGLLPGSPFGWAWLVTTGEASGGLLYCLALLAPPQALRASRPLLAAPAVVAALGLTLYAVRLWQRRSSAPCGCGPVLGDHEIVSGWTVVRALAVLGTVGAGLLTVGSSHQYADAPVEYFLLIAVPLGLALSILVLPSCMQRRPQTVASQAVPS